MPKSAPIKHSGQSVIFRFRQYWKYRHRQATRGSTENRGPEAAAPVKREAEISASLEKKLPERYRHRAGLVPYFESWTAASMIPPKSLAFSAAPPIRPPSIFFWANNSGALPGFIEPP